MILFEDFKKIIETIQQFEKDNDDLSRILLKNNSGFVDYSFPLIDITLNLLNDVLKVEDRDLIGWWLYEKVEKIIYYNDKKIKYDLTDIKDLYYYVLRQYDNVKKVI